MSQRRHLPEQLRKDVLARDQELDRLHARTDRSLDEILTLGGEQPCLEPMLSGSEKLPDEPELLVLTRLDQAACEPGSASASSAAFARSATAANACGSETAMSASDLRSSSIPAFFTPSMNRL